MGGEAATHRWLAACVCLLLLQCEGSFAFVVPLPIPLSRDHFQLRQFESAPPRASAAAVRLRSLAMSSGKGIAEGGDGQGDRGKGGEAGGSAHFINLSNGAESLPLLSKLSVPYSYTRMQSSHCESQNFDGILSNLGPALLIHLAMGTTCYIHDYGSRNKKRKAPRAVWYGVTFVKYALHKLWDLEGEPATPMLRGHNVSGEFDRAIMRLDKGVKKQVRYYANYLKTRENRIQLFGVVGSTDIDGRRDLHAALVHDHAASGGLLMSGEQEEGVLEAVLESGMTLFDTDVGFVQEE